MKKKLIAVCIAILLVGMGGNSFAQGESGSVLSSSYGSTYVVKADGTLWGSGVQYTGNGNGYREEQVAFVKILDGVRSVSSGGAQARVAVKKDDTLWGWGSLEGYPAGGNKLDPTLLYPTKLAIDDVKLASVSDRFILALKNEGSLWICGDMYTGDGTNKKALSKVGFEKVAENVIDMYADNKTVFFLKDDHTLWGYGDTNYAQLGNMISEKADTLTPIKILDEVKSIATNYGTSVVGAIRLDNSLYLWGSGGFYTQSEGWIENAGRPYKVMDNVRTAAVDAEAALIVKMDNTLWRWGESYEGDNVADERIPYKIAEDVLDVTIGERHSAILKTDRTLWVMGGDYRGGLGYEANETWYTPLTQVLDGVQDSPDTWAHKEVEKAIGAQLIPEDMQSHYTKPITREEFCILAIRMIEVKADMSIEAYLQEVGIENAPKDTFEDCDTKEVLAAKALQIVKGTSETTFEPEMLLNREMAAAFLTRTAQACGREVVLSTPNYADLADISAWAKAFTGYVYDIGVLKGTSGNKFDPKGSYQRQQAFMSMYRIWQAIDAVQPENVEASTDASTSLEGIYPPNIGWEDDYDSIGEVAAYLSYKPYAEAYMATYVGTHTTQDGVEKRQKNIYYRAVEGNIQIREDTYSEGRIASIGIFNATAHTTFMRMYQHSNYAETVNGNYLEFKFLEPDYFKQMQVGGNFDAWFEDDGAIIYTLQVQDDGVFIEQWFSATNRMPVKYRAVRYVAGHKTVLAYELVDLDESYDILDFIMDAERID